MILNGIHMSRIYAKGGLNPWNGPTELGQQLKTAKSKVPSKDLLILFYITCIRPVVEYACELFHDSLPKYQSGDLVEKLQNRA
jgi:hypothetical protein